MTRRIPLEPVVEKIGNYYEAVHVAAKRARDLYTMDYSRSARTKREKSIKKP